MGLRNLGKVTDPGQATSPGELFPCLAGLAADMAIAGMIDEKIELWPILRSFGDIAHIGIAPKVWVTLLQSLGEQSLVDAKLRSEERRVGKECVRPCRSRGSPDH